MDEIEARSKAGGADAASPRSQPRSASPARRSSHPSPPPAAPAAGDAVPQLETRVSSRGHPRLSLRSTAALGATPGIPATARRKVAANGNPAAVDLLSSVKPASQPPATALAVPQHPATHSPGQQLATSPPAPSSGATTDSLLLIAAAQILYFETSLPATDRSTMSTFASCFRTSFGCDASRDRDHERVRGRKAAAVQLGRRAGLPDRRRGRAARGAPGRPLSGSRMGPGMLVHTGVHCPVTSSADDAAHRWLRVVCMPRVGVSRCWLLLQACSSNQTRVSATFWFASRCHRQLTQRQSRASSACTSSATPPGRSCSGKSCLRSAICHPSVCSPLASIAVHALRSPLHPANRQVFCTQGTTTLRAVGQQANCMFCDVVLFRQSGTSAMSSACRRMTASQQSSSVTTRMSWCSGEKPTRECSVVVRFKCFQAAASCAARACARCYAALLNRKHVDAGCCLS